MTKDGKTAVIQQNIYNGEGQRIQKVDGDETTNYYYQNGVVAYTTDANGEQNSQNLIGTDGNIYALLGRARQALRRGGRPDLVEPMTKEVLGSKSDELIL